MYSHTEYTAGEETWDDWWNPYNEFWTTKTCYDDAYYCDNQFRDYSGMAGTHNKPLEFVDFPSNGQDPAKPSCPYTGAVPAFRAFCAGKAKPLSTTQTQRWQAAVSGLRAKGGPCVALADAAALLFGRGDLTFFPRSNYKFNGITPRGGGLTGVYSWSTLDRTWLDKWYDATNRTPPQTGAPSGLTAQGAIAHEMDHLINHAEHPIDANGDTLKALTPLTLQCDG